MCVAPSDAMVSYLCWSVIIKTMSGLDVIRKPFIAVLTRLKSFKHSFFVHLNSLITLNFILSKPLLAYVSLASQRLVTPCAIEGSIDFGGG